MKSMRVFIKIELKQKSYLESVIIKEKRSHTIFNQYGMLHT